MEWNPVNEKMKVQLQSINSKYQPSTMCISAQTWTSNGCKGIKKTKDIEKDDDDDDNDDEDDDDDDDNDDDDKDDNDNVDDGEDDDGDKTKDQEIC
ncbi:calsequestrin-1-like [Anneissia japonica]|uniref:calsequestrin-1-like n=1 Tax=Anneissia japonica TaxID=1529436 RepID=UPI00142570DF|nr:calsequestrin-1-like [Anneissia japonica]